MASEKEEFILYQNFPEPFHTQTNIPFFLPEETSVIITIMNTRNEIVTVIQKEKLSRGEHIIKWDGKNSANKETENGSYNYKLEAAEGSFLSVRRMTKKIKVITDAK